ncbi:hypothetical protein, partial [Mesorhizobium tianshanense]|uniref:hypothetical protein n=1 Tax=Mesorhizobium tianshanense TaxID=39844 RepID=UPI0024E08BAA
ATSPLRPPKPHRRASRRLDEHGGGVLFSQRVVRVYQVTAGLPTIYIAKPDEKRFWTRSAGLLDGDEVALDLFTWLAASEKPGVEAVR